MALTKFFVVFCGLFLLVGVVSTLAGSGTAAWADGLGTTARFNNPRGVAVASNGAVIVADTLINMIRMISSAGELLFFC